RQVPKLINAREDFNLTVVPDKLPPAAEGDLGATYPEPLRALWQLRDDWPADFKKTTPAAARSRLESALLRAEKRWRGGIDLGELKTELALARSEAEDRRKAVPLPDTPSLAREVAQSEARVKKLDINKLQATLTIRDRDHDFSVADDL